MEQKNRLDNTPLGWDESNINGASGEIDEREIGGESELKTSARKHEKRRENRSGERLLPRREKCNIKHYYTCLQYTLRLRNLTKSPYTISWKITLYQVSRRFSPLAASGKKIHEGN